MAAGEEIYVCPDHGAPRRGEPCCKKGGTLTGIRELNSMGLPNTHMVADLADALEASLEREREKDAEIERLERKLGYSRAAGRLWHRRTMAALERVEALGREMSLTERDTAALHGLWAFDGAAPGEAWQLDTSEAVGRMRAALGEAAEPAEAWVGGTDGEDDEGKER